MHLLRNLWIVYRAPHLTLMAYTYWIKQETVRLEGFTLFIYLKIKKTAIDIEVEWREVHVG